MGVGYLMAHRCCLLSLANDWTHNTRLYVSSQLLCAKKVPQSSYTSVWKLRLWLILWCCSAFHPGRLTSSLRLSWKRKVDVEMLWFDILASFTVKWEVWRQLWSLWPPWGPLSKKSSCSPAHPFGFVFLLQERQLFGAVPSPRSLPPCSSLSSDFKGTHPLWHFHWRGDKWVWGLFSFFWLKSHGFCFPGSLSTYREVSCLSQRTSSGFTPLLRY